MQFKHPEILYALLLLIIPILVHLFQLQRFVKVPFTNVKFLKKVEQQTRKSARLKKLLILVTRMLAFACLIIAFSQPFISKYTSQQNFDTTIFLDNSFSMQAKGKEGELLKSNVQNIIHNLATQNKPISLITNNESFKNLDAVNLKNELINIQYTPNQFDLNSVTLQLNRMNLTKTNTLQNNILISDFQKHNIDNKTEVTNVNTSLSLLKTTPNKNNNIYIDSVFVENTNSDEITINIRLKSVKNNDLSVPVSLFEDTKLIGKTTAKFNNTNQKNLQFSIPYTSNFNGKISLTDPVLTFDNDFYFCISKPTKINVLNIGDSNDFLAKIYTQNEFNFTSNSLQNLNYNNIQNQQLIILSELKNIPTALANSIDTFVKNGGSIAIIPSENCDLNTYNKLFKLLEIGQLKSKNKSKHSVVEINYNHPLITDVFEKKVTNFQYPTTSIYYDTQFTASSSILKLDNNIPFISSIKSNINTIYWIASPLNNNVSDFTKSSLVVPVFYNFAKNSLKTPQLYYTIGTKNNIEIAAKIDKDEVLKISNGNSEMIPLQTISQNKIHLNIEDLALQNGFYNVLNNNKIVQTLAFNYDTSESSLQYTAIDSLAALNKNITILSSVDEIFNKISNQQKINWLFKWFLAFSALFLFIEMLILKYFKI